MVEGKAASTDKSMLGKSEFKNGKLDSSGPLAQPPKCPECTSQKVWKAGFRVKANGSRIRRFECGNCGRRFSAKKPFQKFEVSLQSAEGSSSSDLQLGKHGVLRSRQFFPRERQLQDLTFMRRQNVFSHRKHLNSVDYERKHINTVVDNSSKQVAHLETTQKLATTTKPPDLRTELLDLSLQMKRNGNSERTIKETAKTLRLMVKRGANLYDPESVKEVIANTKTWCNHTKRLAVKTYDRFAKFIGITWLKPKYKEQPKKPYIPLEKDIDALIAYCGKKTSTLLQLLKETGARCGEARQLKWRDIDFEQSKIYINDPEKNSDARVIKVSRKLIGMLQSMPREPDQQRIWMASSSCLRSNFYRQRKRASYKLANSNFMKIHFHTFRHWKATMEYHKTRDILHVKRLLGHRNINSTLIYTQLIENTASEDFHFSTAENDKEAKPLIEKGFEYVATTPQGVMLFKKRK